MMTRSRSVVEPGAMTMWSAVALFGLSISLGTPSARAQIPPEPVVAPDASTPTTDLPPGTEPTFPVPSVEAQPSTPSPPPSLPRPRLSFAIGAGAAIDNSGTVDGRSVPVPAFYVSTGVGNRNVGFEAALSSTQASGRYRRRVGSQDDVGVDRSAVDLMIALRPAWFDLSALTSPSQSWASDTWRSVTFDLGIAIERISANQQSAFRSGLVTGAHVDLLRLTPRDASSAFALRLGVRRMFSSPKMFSTPALTVSDTLIESFASIAASF